MLILLRTLRWTHRWKVKVDEVNMQWGEVNGCHVNVCQMITNVRNIIIIIIITILVWSRCWQCALSRYLPLANRGHKHLSSSFIHFHSRTRDGEMRWNGGWKEELNDKKALNRCNNSQTIHAMDDRYKSHFKWNHTSERILIPLNCFLGWFPVIVYSNPAQIKVLGV